MADARADLPLVVVPGPELDWGLPADHIKEAVALADWTGEAPKDLSARLGLPPGQASEGARVLVVRSEGKEIPVRTTGNIALEVIPAGLISALPELVLASKLARASLAGVVLRDGERPILVVRAEGLLK